MLGDRAWIIQVINVLLTAAILGLAAGLDAPLIYYYCIVPVIAFTIAAAAYRQQLATICSWLGTLACIAIAILTSTVAPVISTLFIVAWLATMAIFANTVIFTAMAVFRYFFSAAIFA